MIEWPFAMAGPLSARMPTTCACGAKFTVDHALSTAKGMWLTIIRHNEIYDLTATLRTEVVHDVQIEPDLQPLTIEHLACASANFQDAWCEIRHSGK